MYMHSPTQRTYQALIGKPENSMNNIFMAEKLETENLERQNIQEHNFREGKFQACLKIQE